MSGAGRGGPGEIARRFEQSGFICSPDVATSLHLSDVLNKPLLLEGPPGVGKTEIAKLWAAYHEAGLIRLQCYEGLDEAKALYEWSYGKQMLYAQLLREKVGDVLAGAPDLRSSLGALRGQADEFFSRDFLLPRPLLAAITSDRPAVLLVDEVDRSDEEFEAFLLEVLSDHQVSIPELGTVRAKHPPRVILTSNDTRELSDALRRRCLYLYVDFPSFDDEMRIVAARVPGLSEELARRVVAFVQGLRKTDLRRAPGIAEVVDWARALAALGASGLDAGTLKQTLGALLKSHDDIERVLSAPPRSR
ncbi:MAG TPA: MoxR family ATPase [Candidatus Polarisedimenticolia bacterium]|nr:MoxR family ATPase [Candidatus Polarisedimenticolia bacterium]